MPLIDREIRELLHSGILQDAQEAYVQNICYDLRTAHFFSLKARSTDHVDLMPGESIFVMSVEKIRLPNDMIAHVILRNSRIRQGLALEAPIYQPGHWTNLYFRITNVSKSKIGLDTKDGLASVLFERLSGPVEKPYNKTFQEEFDFRGMGDYESKFRGAMEDLEDKADEIRHIEKSMYGNVINLMVIFIGIFSLININIQMAISDIVDVPKFLVFNLTTVGSVSFLAALIDEAVGKSEQLTGTAPARWRWIRRHLRWIMAGVCFLAAILIYLLGMAA